MGIKPFSQTLYDLCDEPVKKVAKQFFSKYFGLIGEDGTKYGVDLYFHKNGKLIVPVECAKRGIYNWHDSFPFSTIHVEYRKLKIMCEHEPLYFATNSDMTRALILTGKQIVNSPKVRTNNCYAQDEPFFDVPRDEAIYIDLTKYISNGGN
jgi:hypothetical protein